MKKLLSLLATVRLVSTSTASVVACGNGNNGPIDDNDDYEEKDISTIISVTDLGEINFHSLTGNDVQTQTEIINQVRNLNPNVGDAQINILSVDPVTATATISVLGFSGSLTVTFTILEAKPNPIDVEVPSTVWSTAQIKGSDMFLVVGGTTGGTGAGDAFVAVVDPFSSQVHVLPAIGLPAFPNSILELQDGSFLIAGGTNWGGANSFLATVAIDLFDPANSQIQILAQGSGDAFPSIPRSMIQLQDGTILVAGGGNSNGSDSFLASVDLSDPANPQTQILEQNIFATIPWSIIQLQDGTILVVGGTAGGGGNAFLSLVDLFDPANPQIQILAQGSSAFPSAPRSMIELQDGTILVAGGNPGISFFATFNLFDFQIQIFAQGPTILPATPRSLIQLQDGTILVAGGFLPGDSGGELHPFLVQFNL